MTECADHHWVCRDCITEFINTRIKEHKVRDSELTCPVGCAGGFIGSHTVKASVPADVYARYLDLRLRKEWAAGSRTAECPRCGFITEIEHGDSMWKVRCLSSRCNVKEFCGQCGDRPHRKQADQDLTCEQFAAWRAEQEGGLRPEAVRKMLSDLKMQICPKCGEAGELKGGCLGGRRDPKGHVGVCMVKGKETGLSCLECPGWSFGKTSCKKCNDWRGDAMPMDANNNEVKPKDVKKGDCAAQ
eukprot:gene32527-13010_t